MVTLSEGPLVFKVGRLSRDKSRHTEHACDWERQRPVKAGTTFHLYQIIRTARILHLLNCNLVEMFFSMSGLKH